MVTEISTKPGFLREQYDLITDYWSTHTPGEGYAEFAEEASQLVKESVADQNRYVQSSAGSALGVTLLAGSIGAGLFEWGYRVVAAKFEGKIPAVELVRFPVEGIIGGAVSVYETGKKWINEGIPEDNYDASYEVTSTLGTAVLLAGGARAVAKGGVGFARNLSGLAKSAAVEESFPHIANRGGIVLDAVEEVGPDGEVVLRVPRETTQLPAIAQSADYQLRSFPSGLQVDLVEGVDIVQAASQVLNDSADSPIPNNRIVLNTQGWEAVPVITTSLIRALQAMAETTGVTICLKTTVSGYLATEFESAAEVARQQAAGPMAVAGESGEAPQLPPGYNLIPGGNFQGQEIAPFGFKRTPVTNGEWEDGALETNRYVSLEHDWQTGTTRLKGQGPTINEALQGPLSSESSTDFDRSAVMIYGPLVLVKMVSNPSAIFDKSGRVFSDPMQPVVGVSWFHAQARNLLETLRSGGRFTYGLPDDLQYEYIASDRGTRQYGTETGTLYGVHGKKLAHIGEYNNGRGTTVAVDDPRYTQELPFDVQTTGNVWRWMAFNPKFKQPGNYFSGPYGWRGGSWLNDPGDGRAVIRFNALPFVRYDFAGFSPVVVRQGSK